MGNICHQLLPQHLSMLQIERHTIDRIRQQIEFQDVTVPGYLIAKFTSPDLFYGFDQFRDGAAGLPTGDNADQNATESTDGTDQEKMGQDFCRLVTERFGLSLLND